MLLLLLINVIIIENLRYYGNKIEEAFITIYKYYIGKNINTNIVHNRLSGYHRQ